MCNTAVRALALLFLATPAFAAVTPFHPPKTITVHDTGPLFLHTHPALLGMDGAFSVATGPGTALWVFGDTLVGQWGPDGKRVIASMPANSAATVTNSEWKTGFPGARLAATTDTSRYTGPVEVLHVAGRPAGRRVWPMDAARVGADFWLWFVEIEAFGKGPLDFKVTGVGAARRSNAPLWRFDASDTLWGDDAPLYGSSVLAHGDKLYLYAGGDPTRLARVSPRRIADRAAYEYWTGTGWSHDAAAAGRLPASGPELSVRPNAYLGGFVMVYTPPFGRTVTMRFAQAPEGPWSAPRDVARCQPGDAEAMFYGAKQHAELDEAGGQRIVVTYNTNVKEDRLAGRPDLYWPRAVQVTFTR